MHCLKKNNSRYHLINIGTNLIFILLGYLLFTANCEAKAIEIEQASFTLHDNTYYLNAILSFELSEESRKALAHGIPLQLHTVTQVKQIRTWLWNRKIVERLLNFKLQYHPLSGHYIVTSINTGKRNSFKSLGSALKYLGTIKNVPFFDKILLENSHKYKVTMKAFIDIESLPAPMRLIAYFSSDWQLSSSPYSWDLIL